MSMKLFEGKSPAERNKIILAMVLGGLAVIALAYTFGGSIFGSKKATTANSTTSTPTPGTNPNSQSPAMLSPEEIAGIDELYANTPLTYSVASFSAPDAGRNIFAFYEPPILQQTPIPISTPRTTPIVFETPKPTPTPDFVLGFMNTTNVYAGSKGFRLQLNGDRFTPDSVILFNSVPLPTTFVSPQSLTADVAANLIVNAGNIEVKVQTLDGLRFSNPMGFQVIAAPRPQFQYIGMIARSRYNNDTAYFSEQGKTTPISGRLGDVVGGRFKLVSISSVETVFDDTSLGFRYKLPLLRPKAGETTGGKGGGSNPGGVINQPDCPPGIPCQPGQFSPNQPFVNGVPNGIPRNVPGIPNNPNQKRDDSKDYDDDDDGDGY
jgi:hypothetical protein